MMCVRGAGESNTDSFQGTDAGAVNYACRMRAAVQDWRSALDAPDLPFFNVELAACDNYPDKASNHFIWAAIRQASRSFLSLSGTTGFITTIDVGIKGEKPRPSARAHSMESEKRWVCVGVWQVMPFTPTLSSRTGGGWRGSFSAKSTGSRASSRTVQRSPHALF